MKQKHQPVLLEATLALLDPQSGESYLDGTAGYGGHAAAIVERIGPKGRAVLVDRDDAAIRSLKVMFDSKVEIVQANYLDAAKAFVENKDKFNLILLDLGVSSPQLDQSSRGFSFNSEDLLDMRMDQSQTLSAYEVVNNYDERTLADVIYRYGEEPRARVIARAICAARPLRTGQDLARVVRQVASYSKSIDPATRTFQAIRIEVNAELSSLERALPVLCSLLAPGGRIAIISFHSLEDRLVKQYFDSESRDCLCPPKQPVCTCAHVATLTKLGRVVNGQTQDVNNPRARSAKLRAAVKLKPKTKEGK